MAIRLAIGATPLQLVRQLLIENVGALPQSVVGMITRQGGRWIALGLGIGLVVSIGALRLIGGLVLGVSATDPLPAVVVLCLLAGAGPWPASYRRDERAKPTPLPS